MDDVIIVAVLLLVHASPGKYTLSGVNGIVEAVKNIVDCNTRTIEGVVMCLLLSGTLTINNHLRIEPKRKTIEQQATP